MEDVKDIIAKNLVELRTRAKLTQIQLANMLNYSDKAVSKWERGDAVPDLRVLIKLSEIYGVTVDDIVKSKDITLKVHPKKLITGKRGFVVAMSSVLVWFVATIIFIVLFSFPITQKYAYLVFVCATLPTSIILMVFSCIWGNRITTALTSSLVVWMAIMTSHIVVMTFTDFTTIHLLYIVGAVFELLIILWFTYRWFATKKAKILKDAADKKLAEKAASNIDKENEASAED